MALYYISIGHENGSCCVGERCGVGGGGYVLCLEKRLRGGGHDEWFGGLYARSQERQYNANYIERVERLLAIFWLALTRPKDSLKKKEQFTFLTLI